MPEDHPPSAIVQVCAIVVAFYPDERLPALIAELATQVGAIVVVDNTPVGQAGAVETEQATLIALGDNLGIAAAHNRGIEWAREQGFGFVLLMDQDSQPDAGMVAAQLAAYDDLIRQGKKIAALAPRFHDARYGVDAPFIQLHDYRIARVGCQADDAPVEAAYVISSGSLIPLGVLNAVGDMREELFIDYVDIEWGLRARKRGYGCYGLCTTRMHHRLGDDARKLPWPGGRRVPIRGPLRHYYLFRNAIWMYRQGWVPWQWKLEDAWRLLMKFGYYALFTAPRWEQVKMMSRGLWDGLRGRMGRYRGA